MVCYACPTLIAWANADLEILPSRSAGRIVSDHYFQFHPMSVLANSIHSYFHAPIKRGNNLNNLARNIYQLAVDLDEKLRKLGRAWFQEADTEGQCVTFPRRKSDVALKKVIINLDEVAIPMANISDRHDSVLFSRSPDDKAKWDCISLGDTVPGVRYFNRNRFVS